MSVLGLIGNTPLVQLRCGVFAKCEHLNPGGSVKDRIAKAIVLEAEARGVLRPGATLIEATAGNTGVGLALVAAERGYSLVCVMPEKMAAEKRRQLALLGARVVITPNAPPSSPENFRRVAERLAQEYGWFATQQFDNPANPRVHEETTAAEILRQCPEVKAFVAGAGTGGTITGVARVLKPRGVRIVLADPVGSLYADLVDGKKSPDLAYAVEGIGGSERPQNLDASLIDAVERISDVESFETARALIRDEGLLVGGSAGTNVAAAKRVLEQTGGPVVTVLPDSWDRYAGQPWLK